MARTPHDQTGAIQRQIRTLVRCHLERLFCLRSRAPWHAARLFHRANQRPRHAWLLSSGGGFLARELKANAAGPSPTASSRRRAAREPLAASRPPNRHPARSGERLRMARGTHSRSLRKLVLSRMQKGHKILVVSSTAPVKYDESVLAGDWSRLQWATKAPTDGGSPVLPSVRNWSGASASARG